MKYLGLISVLTLIMMIGGIIGNRDNKIGGTGWALVMLTYIVTNATLAIHLLSQS